MVRAASRLEDRGVRNLDTSRQEHPDDRDGHQPAAPAHDRRHDGPQFRGEDAERLHPPRQEPHGLPRPIARHGHSRGAVSLPAQLTEAGVRPPTINAAVSALRFFFSVTVDRPAVTKPLTFVAEPRKIPVVLSPEEVAWVLEAAPGPKYKAALSAAYGAGLRVSEVVALKVSDVDSRRMLLRIEQGKGRRDRFAMLSPQLLELLRDWWRIARPCMGRLMSSDFGRDSSRPDTAIAPDLAEGVLASILVSLVSIAMCTDGTAALLARSRRPNIPVAARVPSSDPVRRREDKLLGESRASTIRGELAIGRGSSRHTLVFGRSTWDRNHDAVMRIGGEAPGRRAHSQERCQHHGWLRVTATLYGASDVKRFRPRWLST